MTAIGPECGAVLTAAVRIAGLVVTTPSYLVRVRQGAEPPAASFSRAACCCPGPPAGPACCSPPAPHSLAPPAQRAGQIQSVSACRNVCGLLAASYKCGPARSGWRLWRQVEVWDTGSAGGRLGALVWYQCCGSECRGLHSLHHSSPAVSGPVTGVTPAAAPAAGCWSPPCPAAGRPPPRPPAHQYRLAWPGGRGVPTLHQHLQGRQSFFLIERNRSYLICKLSLCQGFQFMMKPYL